jgi:hypothetical protein
MLFALTLGCAGAVVRVPGVPPPRQLVELGADAVPRDLFRDSGGASYTPAADAVYALPIVNSTDLENRDDLR